MSTRAASSWIASILIGAAAIPAPAAARQGSEPRLQPVLGELRRTSVEPGDTLLDVAYRERVGFLALVRLNPELDRWIPRVGAPVRLPTRYVLPEAERSGLVINVPEMRLYDFTTGGDPRVYAIAIGNADNPTPLGTFAIGAKRVDPTWFVPDSIRRERPQLPALVPPGPDNPLGRRWMNLGLTTYGIHGTNSRWSVGSTSTHGCVRLYEDQVRALFTRIPEGTPVRIVYQPLKWGLDGDRVLLEVHPDIYARDSEPARRALDRLEELGVREARADELLRAIERPMGVPVVVGVLPP
jgi:L,D-transpeptidase ErfK/SrfK